MLAQIKSQALQAKHREVETKLLWVLQLGFPAPGAAAHPLLPRRRLLPPPRAKCQTGNGELLVTTVQKQEFNKEVLPTMVGKAWRMTLWEWEERDLVVEAKAWEASLEAGAALEEAKEVAKAPEADPAQTETTISPEEGAAGKATIPRQ